MLATAVDKPFNNKDWVFEVKWDGVRAIAFVRNGVTRLQSRNGNDITATYPEVVDALQKSLMGINFSSFRWRNSGAGQKWTS